MASQFGVLKPLKQYKRQQQHLPHQHLHPHQHYSQFSLQQTSQPPVAPAIAAPPPLPPPSQQPKQHQQRQQQGDDKHQTEERLAKEQRQQHISPVANNDPNVNIHPHLQSQSRSPTLNDTVAGSPRPQQQQVQTMTPIPASASASASTPSLNACSADPPTTTTAATAMTTAPHIDTPCLDSQRRNRTPARPSKRRRGDNGADSPLSSSVTPHQSTVHPLNKGPYNTLEDAIFSLQLHVFTSGYGVSQKRTVKEKLPSGKYDPDGDIIRKDFVCDKGGNEFVSQSRGERRRESKKCGCPWKAAIRRLRREGDRWFIEILETHHNHPVTSPDEMHNLASYRRWQRENNAGIRSAIARLTRAAAMPARDIAAYLKGTIQDHDLDRIDKHILRALSMNDKDTPGSEREGGAIVFEMVARRPVIILQDTTEAYSSSTAVNGYSSVPNPTPPVTNFLDPATPTAPFHQSSPTYHHTFANTFAQPSHPLPTPNPPTPMTGDSATASMHTAYPVIP